MKATTRLMTAMMAWTLSSLLFIAQGANSVTTVDVVTSSVDITEDVDYVITDATPFATAGSVNIVNLEHAVVRFSEVIPSQVIANWMNNIFINGEKAVNGTNCQVKMYNRGAIVFPYDKDFRPLTCYTEENFGGESNNTYTEGHSGGFMKSLNETNLNNEIRSFKLKRGYMVTFAVGSAGWGYSRCFVAADQDLEVPSLPPVLSGRISSYRVFKWYDVSKVAIAEPDGNLSNCRLLHATSTYRWGVGENLLPDVECVTHQNQQSTSASSLGSASFSCHMKTDNEPLNGSDPGQTDMATILKNWPSLMRTGMRICTPSSWDGSDYWNGTGFIKNLLDSIDAKGWRCDIVDAHCYWTEGNFNNLSYWVNNMHRPIWISEFVWGASWSGGSGIFSAASSLDNPTDADLRLNRNAVQRICNNLNSMDYVERYFYWNYERNCSKLIRNRRLTPAGEMYSELNSGLAYNGKYDYIPKDPPYERIGALTYKYKSTEGTVTLTWDDPNGDLVTALSVLCKLPEETTWTEIATITPKDKNSASGVNYTYTDSVSESGNYVYRIKVTWFNGNKTYYSNEVNVNVAPAKGTAEFQHGRLTLDSEEEFTTVFSERFDKAPKVFLGTVTNKNSTYYAGNYLKSITTSNFVYKVLPWNTNKGSLKNAEEIPFFALKDSCYTFKGYKGQELQCEVGEVKSATSSDTLWSDTTVVTFENPFPEDVVPVVLTEVRQPTAQTTVFNVRVFDVTNTGFKFIVYTENSTGVAVTSYRNVEYLAITPGVGALDEENGLYIAAGHGMDENIYGSSQRENRFLVKNPVEDDDTLQLYLNKPSVLTALQTNNYPTIAMLRRTDTTEKDAEGNTWYTAVKVKPIHDTTIQVDGKTVSATTTAEPYRENMGWVCISDHILIGPDMKELTFEPDIDEDIPGDVNEDGEVDINDVVAIINVMAGTAEWPNANVNGDEDGKVDINDVVAVINIMASK